MVLILTIFSVKVANIVGNPCTNITTHTCTHIHPWDIYSEIPHKGLHSFHLKIAYQGIPQPIYLQFGKVLQHPTGKVSIFHVHDGANDLLTFSTTYTLYLTFRGNPCFIILITDIPKTVAQLYYDVTTGRCMYTVTVIFICYDVITGRCIYVCTCTQLYALCNNYMYVHYVLAMM